MYTSKPYAEMTVDELKTFIIENTLKAEKARSKKEKEHFSFFARAAKRELDTRI